MCTHMGHLPMSVLQCLFCLTPCPSPMKKASKHGVSLYFMNIVRPDHSQIICLERLAVVEYSPDNRTVDARGLCDRKNELQGRMYGAGCRRERAHLWQDVFQIDECHVHLIADLLHHRRVVHGVMHQTFQLWKFRPARSHTTHRSGSKASHFPHLCYDSFR